MRGRGSVSGDIAAAAGVEGVKIVRFASACCRMPTCHGQMAAREWDKT